MSVTTTTPVEHASRSSAPSDVRSAYDWVRETARDNPALIVGGALAVGALAAVILVNRRPASRARAAEKRIGRELRSIEKAIRRHRPISSMSDRLAEASGAIASELGSWDQSTIRGLFSRMSDLSSHYARRAGF